MFVSDCLDEQLHDGFAPSADEGGASTAFGVEALFHVHTHGGGDGGVKVLGFEFRIGFPAFLIRLPDGLPTLNSSSCEHTGETIRVVVATTIALDLGGTAKLGGDDDHCALEHAAVAEVGKEGGGGTV